MMREQARVIATHHSYWKRHGGNFRAKNAVPFEKWFLIGIRNRKKGAEFDLLSPGLFQIKWGGSPDASDCCRSRKGISK